MKIGTKGLNGAKFKITGTGENADYEKTITMSSDTYTIKNLEPGKYNIQETKAPDGYEIDTTVVTVEVKAGENPTEVTFKNKSIDPGETELTIIKKDTDGNLIAFNDDEEYIEFNIRAILSTTALSGSVASNAKFESAKNWLKSVKFVNSDQDKDNDIDDEDIRIWLTNNAFIARYNGWKMTWTYNNTWYTLVDDQGSHVLEPYKIIMNRSTGPQVTLYKLYTGWKYSIEEKINTVKYYDSNDNIGIKINGIELEKGKPKEVTITNKKIVKSVGIQKFAMTNANQYGEDVNTGWAPYAGVKFRIRQGQNYISGYENDVITQMTTDAGAAKIFETDIQGKIVINNLYNGVTLTFEELDQFNNVILSQDVTTGENETTIQPVYNQPPKLGSIKIAKVNSVTGNKLKPGVKFMVKRDDTGLYVKETYTNNLGWKFIEYTSNQLEAKIYTTQDENRDGETDDLTINDLELGKYYKFVEIDTGSENWQYQAGTEFGPYEARNRDIVNSEAPNKVENIPVYVKLVGCVWEDLPISKISERDYLYNNVTIADDKLVNNVKVTVRDKTTHEIIRDVDYGYCEYNTNYIVTPVANQDGTYMTGRLRIDQLSNYYIQFEYNGMSYQVVDLVGIGTGYNAATENDRQGFNNNFEVISKDLASPGNYTLTYNRDGNAHKSTLIYGDNCVYGYDNQAYPINGVYDQYKITANAATDLADRYAIMDVRHKDLGIIEHLNLGLYERAQPDLAILTDIDNIRFNINGYEESFECNSRKSYINTGIPDQAINPGYQAIMDGFSVSVKNSFTGKYNTTYTRGIYESYIAFTKNNQYSDDKLKVFVTYKIVLKNEGSGLISKVQSLRNYTDKRYVNASSYIEGSGTEISWTNVGEENGHAIWQANIYNDEYIGSGECMTIYLKYELSTDTIIEMANLDVDGEISISSTVTEITSYSTKDLKRNIYAGIDKDSAPQNIDYGNVSTYEDDTDAAPDLGIQRKPSKEMSGLVFEDKVNNSDYQRNTLKTGEERLGNGIYEDGENKVQDVEVRILDYNNKQTIQLYTLDTEGRVNITDALAYTNDGGMYNFVGFIPGKYYIQYIYGSYKDNEGKDKQTKIKEGNSDIEVTTQDYKSTIVDYDKFHVLIENEDLKTIENMNLWYWYQNRDNFTYSSAVDDSDWRNNINDNLAEIDYSVKNTYDTKSNIESLSENYYMVAKSGIMNFRIDDSEDINLPNIYEMKFGIIERARQSIQVNKEISNITLTLANGQVLAQGDPRNEKINYVTCLDGLVKIEVDNEIIQGAILEIEYAITVENLSERDYNSKEYYYYGRGQNNDLVKIKLDSIVDYLDEKLSVNQSDVVYYDSSSETEIIDKWQVITHPEKEKNMLAGIIIDESVYQIVKNRSNMLVRNTSIELKPKEKSIINLNAQRELSNINNSDMIFDNYTELIKVSNSVGRFYGELKSDGWTLITPGNFNIKDITNTNEADNSNKAQLTIIPPTGEGNIVIYSVIGIACLVMLIGGIILIKKFVLD